MSRLLEEGGNEPSPLTVSVCCFLQQLPIYHYPAFFHDGLGRFDFSRCFSSSLSSNAVITPELYSSHPARTATAVSPHEQLKPTSQPGPWLQQFR